MSKINRLLTNICSKNLEKSKAFYTALLPLNVTFDSDWFVHLTAENEALELGIILQTHQIVPAAAQNPPTGFYITFVVDDVDAIYEKAKAKKLEIVSVPENTSYGQRRMLLKDPDGAIVDISAPMK